MIKKTPKKTTRHQFSFAVDKAEKDRLEKAAIEKGMNLTNLYKEGAEMLASFDSTFWSRIEQFSKTFKIDKYLVMQNLCLAWFARFDAEREVNGLYKMMEFQFTDKGAVTGEELYKTLKANLKKEIQK